jgi:site-specific recombinase XerD
MGELRERMTHALVIRGLSSRTQESYLAAVKGLAKYYHQRPDELSESEVQGYIRHLMEERKLAPNSVRLTVSGLKFFYEVTLKAQPFELPLPKGAKRRPEILSRQDKLARCRQLLAPAPAVATTAPSTLTQGTDSSPTANDSLTSSCPVCGLGPLRIVEILPPRRDLPP